MLSLSKHHCLRWKLAVFTFERYLAKIKLLVFKKCLVYSNPNFFIMALLLSTMTLPTLGF